MSLSCLDTPCIYQFGERLGIFVTVLASTASAVSVVGLLIYAAIKRWRSLKHMSGHGNSDASAFILLLSLLAADLFQAIGGMPSWKWMLDAHLTEGALCTFQSLFLNIGNVAIALSALSIALHTFCVLILRWKFSPMMLRIVAASIWCLTALIIGICNRGQKHYYGDAGYWCWITKGYFVERITGAYLWMWIAFFVMIGLYAFMFLVMRGIIRMNSDADDGTMSQQEQEDERESKQIAYLMLFYPAVYLFCIAPMSISRWIDWSRPNYHSPAGILISHIIFSLSGVFNVILFSVTRPSLVAGSTESLGSSESAEMRQHHPHHDTQGGACPSNHDHKFTTTPGVHQSTAGEGLPGSPKGHLPASIIDVGGEHDLEKHHHPRVPPPVKTTTFQTVKNVHVGHNHGRLPE